MYIGEFVKKMTFYDFDVLVYEEGEKNWFLVTEECAIRFVKELNTTVKFSANPIDDNSIIVVAELYSDGKLLGGGVSDTWASAKAQFDALRWAVSWAILSAGYDAKYFYKKFRLNEMKEGDGDEI